MINETQRAAGIGSYAGRTLSGTGGGDEAGGAAASEASKELGGKDLNENKAAEGAAASQGVAGVGQVDTVAPIGRELKESQEADPQNQAANAAQFQKPPSFVG